MHQIPKFKGAALKRGYGIGRIFKGLIRTFVSIVKKSLLNLGKHALETAVQVLDDVNQVEDVKVAIKRRTEEGAKKIGKKSINRTHARKIDSCKQTVTRSRLLL